MCEAVAELAWSPERGEGPEIDAKPADHAMHEVAEIARAEGLEAEADVAKPAAHGEAAHPRG